MYCRSKSMKNNYLIIDKKNSDGILNDRMTKTDVCILLYFCCIAVSTYPSFSPSHLPSFCPPSFGISRCHPLYPSRSFVYPSISPCPSLPPFLFDNGGLSAGICRHPFQAADNGLSAGPDLAMDEPACRYLSGRSNGF